MAIKVETARLITWKAAWLADQGLAVAGIEYRVSERARFPAPSDHWNDYIGCRG